MVFTKHLLNEILGKQSSFTRSPGDLLSDNISVWSPALIGSLVNLLSLPSISLKHLIGYRTCHCHLKFTPLVSHLPFVLFYIIIFSIDPSL